jgi:hypothetical protein
MHGSCQFSSDRRRSDDYLGENESLGIDGGDNFRRRAADESLDDF